VLVLAREVDAPSTMQGVKNVVSRLMRYFLAAIGGATAIMLLFYFADQGVLGISRASVDPRWSWQ